MVEIGKIRPKHGPEFKIQKDIIKYLREREWFIRQTHGCQWQAGFPDLICAKRRYGTRWIEAKAPIGYKFTDAQLKTFPEFSKNKIGIWVLTEMTDESYQKLFKPPNWAQYLQVAQVYTRNRYSKPKPESKLKIAGSGPERIIQTAIVKKLRADGWFVIETYGSLYQSGFSDLYAIKNGRQAWVEVKNPTNYRFTGRQLEVFHRMMAEGIPIWVLTSDDLSPLDGPANWMNYLK